MKRLTGTVFQVVVTFWFACYINRVNSAAQISTDATLFNSTVQVSMHINSEMSHKGLSNEDITNMIFDSGGNQSDDLEDSEEDYIPSDDVCEIDNLLSEFRTSDDDDHSDEYMFELDHNTSDVRTNVSISRNKSDTWKTEPTKTTRIFFVVIMICEKKNGLTNYAKRTVRDHHLFCSSFVIQY